MKYELDSIDESVVTLDTYNSDLNLVIDASKYSAHSLTKEGFAFMWAGARATHGIAKGKACFEVKVIEQLDVSHLPADEPNPHVVRVGFSVDSSTMQLGEDPLSYGYGGTGKISSNCQFKDFGPPFQAGDCILAVVDMVSDPIQIGFAKNGTFIGWAYKVRKSELQEKALFPHVLTKNCSFEVNFGQRSEPFHKFPEAVRDFTFIGCLPVEQRVGGTRPPVKREDCEMIMMCGLPGAGKSVWAADYSLKNPDKKYNVLGTNNIIDKMKVMGLPRKRNYAGRWDVLIQMATKCLNTMFAIGSKLRRNYILDQTNVYPTAQRRKMRNFDGFRRLAVVVVPTDAEYKRRCDKRDREEGKEIPDSAILEMKANFKLPEVNDIFDDIIFTELQRDEADKLVKVYNEEGKACLGPAKKQFRPNEPDRKGNLGFNRNDSFDSRGSRGNFGNFQGDQGMRGPNSYGGGRGGFNNRGGFNGGRGGGYDSYGGRDYNDGRGGFGDRGGYDSPAGFGGGYDRKEGFDGPYGGGRGGYDNGRSSGRGGYEGSRGGRGGFDGNRGGGRGGYDGNRGGYDSNRSGYDGNRGGYDSNRGGYDSNRGGYDSNRGGYDSNRGGYDGNRGGGRGGFDNNRGRGGYNGNRGGGRGGYDGNRGGGGRGGYDSNRSGGRGGYDGNRGGGRGGYDGNRGSKSDYDGRGARSDSYDNRSDSYGGLGREGGSSSYSSGYGSDRGYDKPSGDMYKSSYDAGENISGAGYGYSDYGSDSYSADKFSNQGYGNNSSNDYKRGSANPRYQQGNRGTTTRGASRGSFQNDSYSKDGTYSSSYSTGESADVQSSYSDGSYGYGTGSYAYKSQSTDSYTSRDTPSSYSTGTAAVKSEPSQRYAGSSSNTGSKYNQGTGFSGTQTTRVTRWSAEVVPQTPAVVTPPADTYSSTRSQSYDYSKSDTSATAYQAKQSYGYTQGLATNIAAQPAVASSVTTTANPGGYADWQAQWMQYGQQMPTNQYYSQ